MSVEKKKTKLSKADNDKKTKPLKNSKVKKKVKSAETDRQKKILGRELSQLRREIEAFNFLTNSFFNYVESPSNRNTYFVCERRLNIFHVLKKVKMSVTEVNNNSVFQPYESKEERVCIISLLIKIMPAEVDEVYYKENVGLYFIENDIEKYLDEEYFDRLKNDLGCIVYTIKRQESIGMILEGIKK